MRNLASIFFFWVLTPLAMASSLTDVMHQARLATVSVLAKKKKKPFQTRSGRVFGTGFIIHSDGYIVTSAHNLSGGELLTVKLWNQDEQPAKVIAQDLLTDIAVLKIKSDKKLPTLEWQEKPVILGQKIFIIGTPFGLEGSISAGIVSEPRRLLSNKDIGLNTAHQISGFIQTDAAMSLGHSGGPMLSYDGKVVGVNAAIISPTEGSAGLGFAVPAHLARFIVDQLLKSGYVRRISLGLELQSLSPELARYFELDKPEGALISGIDRMGHGFKQGLNIGDLILAINGDPVISADSVPELMTLNAYEKEITLKIMRDRKILLINIAVAPEITWSESEQKPEIRESNGANQLFVEEITAMDRLKYEIPSDVQGGIVRQVPERFDKHIFPDSILEKIEGKIFSDVSSINLELEEQAKKSQPVLLHFWFQGRRYFATYP
jgi:serine protease Do